MYNLHEFCQISHHFKLLKNLIYNSDVFIYILLTKWFEETGWFNQFCKKLASGSFYVYYTSTICVSSTIFHENQTGSVAFFLACSQVQSIMLLFLLMIMHNGTWKTTQGPSSIMWLPYMPLKSIPPSIRTSGTLYHVMCAVFSAQWSCVMGWEQSGSWVTTGFNLYNSWERNGPVYI